LGEIQINREHVKHVFAEYTSHYDSSDEKIRLKINHTYRVAALCDRIARSIGLDKQDTDLAWLTGMLHDVGRFEQLRRYGTFSDADSIDHAHYGVQILFEEGKIHEYLPISEEDEEYGIIRAAIWNHSAYRINPDISGRTEMYCNILRDGDKIDILRVNHDVPLEVIYNVSTQVLKHAEVSEIVMQQFFEKHAVLRSTKTTCVDHLVGHISLAFELVYPESTRIVMEQGYLKKILNFQSDNPVTQSQFETLKEYMKKYLESML